MYLCQNDLGMQFFGCFLNVRVGFGSMNETKLFICTHPLPIDTVIREQGNFTFEPFMDSYPTYLNYEH